MKHIKFLFQVVGLYICLIVFPIKVHAQDYTEVMPYFTHLSEINKEWVNHLNAVPKGEVVFKSDNDRIQLHLELVCKYLKLNTPEGLTEEQKNKRLELISDLEVYAKDKSFPINNHHSVRTPYFVDDFGTHCAVGQLIHKSGNDDLVSAIKKAHNYDFIIDIKTEGLIEWSTENGFTVDELKWIQPWYGTQTNLTQIQNGANGIVKKMSNIGDKVVIIGEFDSLNLLPCLNIGYYQDNQLNCFGSGLQGVVNDVVRVNSNIVALGELIFNSVVYPMAMFDGNVWSFIANPDLNGAIGKTAFRSSNLIKLSLSHNSFIGDEELWNYNLSTDIWTKRARVNGVVLDIIANYSDIIYAGHFDTVFTYGNQPDTLVDIYNVIIDNGNPDYWYGIENQVSDSVKVLSKIGNSIYFGGSCSATNQICLTKYLNNTFQTQIFFGSLNIISNEVSIDDMKYGEGTILYITGKFNAYSNSGSTCSNFAKYDLIGNSFGSMGHLDKRVTSVSIFNNEVLFGGHFNLYEDYTTYDSVNYLAKVLEFSNINEESSSKESVVYPNPFTNHIQIKGVPDGTWFRLVDNLGQILNEGEVVDGSIGNLESLENGIYYLSIELDSGKQTYRIVK